jgi:hypothetical protein
MAAYLSRREEQSFAGKRLGRRDLTLAALRERRETLRIYGALVILLFVTITLTQIRVRPPAAFATGQIHAGKLKRGLGDRALNLRRAPGLATRLCFR